MFVRALFISLLFLTVSDAAAQERLALVVGNGGYQTNSWQLSNPVADARAMAEALDALDFEVTLKINTTETELDNALASFGASLRQAGRNAVTFIYYAGHGAQHEGINYLIPVDADARTSDRLRFQSPPLSFLLDDMAAAGNRVNIIVLDACRDMPLADGGRSIGRRGLAPLDDTANVFIGYATAPGSTASDGAGEHSPYTTALLSALHKAPDEPLSLLFEDVSEAVRLATGGDQRPEFRNGLAISRWSLVNSPNSEFAPEDVLENVANTLSQKTNLRIGMDCMERARETMTNGASNTAARNVTCALENFTLAAAEGDRMAWLALASLYGDTAIRSVIRGTQNWTHERFDEEAQSYWCRARSAGVPFAAGAHPDRPNMTC